MALLTLPASTLQDAALRRGRASPGGERGERRIAVWGLVVMLSIGVALILSR